MDIVEDVGDEPTEWCSNVVLTPKKDGQNIRASLHMTDAKKYIKRTRHAIPIIRELGPVSRKPRKLFGPVKSLQNLEPCDYRAVLFAYSKDEGKFPSYKKFQVYSRLRF